LGRVFRRLGKKNRGRGRTKIKKGKERKTGTEKPQIDRTAWHGTVSKEKGAPDSTSSFREPDQRAQIVAVRC